MIPALRSPSDRAPIRPHLPRPVHRLEGEIDRESVAALTAFLEAHPGRPVRLVVNSPGGLASEGAAAAAEVERHGQVEALGQGIVASAATLPFLAARRAVLHRDGLVMVHDPRALVAGDAEELRRWAGDLDRIADHYAAAYARRTGHPLERVRAWMRAETWLGAPEAVALGFADALEEQAAPEPVARFDPARFRHPPAALLRLATEHGWAADPPAQLEDLPPMLDSNDPGAPPVPDAAALAALRMKCRDRGLAPEAADLLLEAGIAPEAAGPFLPVLRRGAERAAIGKLSPEEAREAMRIALADARAATPDGLDEALREHVIAAWAGKGDHSPPAFGPRLGEDWNGPSGFRARMIAGLEAKLDPAHATAMGREAARATLAEVAMEAARRAGLRPTSPAEAIRLAGQHSTSDFPRVVEGALGNVVARRIEQRAPDLLRAARVVVRPDYRPAHALGLSASGMPEEVREGGEVRFVTVDERGEALPLIRDFASGFAVTNQALVNDAAATALLADIAARMAEGAIERQRAVLLEPLLANSGAGQTMRDGTPLFHASRGNLSTGAGSTLSVEGLSAARTAMRRRKGSQGEHLAVEPWGLLVPPECETAAQQLVAQLAPARVDDANPFSGALQVLVEPGLPSPTAWYLLADPARHDGLLLGLLEGHERPRVESRAGWHTLGLEFRLHWPMSASFVEPATWHRSTGA